MNTALEHFISNFSENNIPLERQGLLSNLAHYIQNKVERQEEIRLNFICTHNSRRSHLSQIWAQTMAHHFGIKNLFCYSGGTEATAMFPKVVETIKYQGFDVIQLCETANPVYAVKFDQNEHPIICFSKEYSHVFNPKSKYAAIVTCNSADENCPIVFGAEQRFPIKYNDPKAFDGTDLMDQKYAERSFEIGQEMFFIFGLVAKSLSK